MRIELGQISIYFRIHHTFLVISEKVKETSLSTTSQSLKDGSLTTYEVYEGNTKVHYIRSINFVSKPHSLKTGEVFSVIYYQKPWVRTNEEKRPDRLRALIYIDFCLHFLAIGYLSLP